MQPKSAAWSARKSARRARLLHETTVGRTRALSLDDVHCRLTEAIPDGLGGGERVECRVCILEAHQTDVDVDAAAHAAHGSKRFERSVAGEPRVRRRALGRVERTAVYRVEPRARGK